MVVRVAAVTVAATSREIERSYSGVGEAESSNHRGGVVDDDDDDDNNDDDSGGGGSGGGGGGGGGGDGGDSSPLPRPTLSTCMSLPLYPVTAGTVPAVPTAPTPAPPPTDDPSVPACSVLPCPTLRLSGASPSSDFFCPYTPRPSRQGSFQAFLSVDRKDP